MCLIDPWELAKPLLVHVERLTIQKASASASSRCLQSEAACLQRPPTEMPPPPSAVDNLRFPVAAAPSEQAQPAHLMPTLLNVVCVSVLSSCPCHPSQVSKDQLCWLWCPTVTFPPAVSVGDEQRWTGRGGGSSFQYLPSCGFTGLEL